MKKTILGLFALVALSVSSCNKGDSGSTTPSPTPSTNKRVVKYEVSGNFTGHLSFIYSNESFGYTTVKFTSFPKEVSITYPSNIPGCTAGGNSTGIQAGVSGQTLTLKIYSGGNLVKTVEAVANASGFIEFPNWGSYLF